MALLDSSGNPVKSGSGAAVNQRNYQTGSSSAPAIRNPSAYSYGTNAAPTVVNSLTQGSNVQYPVGFNKNSVNQLPSSPLGMLGGIFSPMSSMAKMAGKTFMNQANYGMNDVAATEYQRLLADPANSGMSAKDLVSMARAPQINNQLPQAMNRSQRVALDEQRAANGLPPLPPVQGTTDGVAVAANTGGDGNMGLFGGEGQLYNPVDEPTALPAIDPRLRDYNPSTGTFKPITFRSGVGDAPEANPYDTSGSVTPDSSFAGLSEMAQGGRGLFEQASGLAQQAPNQFNANFDPAGRSQELFDQRSALLEPAFAQQRAQGQESMFGSGRLGLRLSGESMGAGGDGQYQPDAFGMNQAQSQALAGLAAQSTSDAFGEEMQRSGLDLSQFGANQAAQQQQYANLMGAGSGMFQNSMLEPQMQAQLIAQQQAQQGLNQGYGMGMMDVDTRRQAQLMGQQQSQQGLDQNYQLGMFGALTGADFAQQGIAQQQQGLDQNYELALRDAAVRERLADSNIAAQNYQPDPWLSGLTSLGTSYLGTEGGSNWFKGLFS